MIRPVMAYMLFSVYCFDRNWEIFLVAINKNSMNITHYQFTQSQVTEIRRVRFGLKSISNLSKNSYIKF